MGIVRKTAAGRVPAPSPKADSEVTVKSGDTLSQLALRFKTTVDELLELNPRLRNRHTILAGQTLKLPDTARPGASSQSQAGRAVGAPGIEGTTQIDSSEQSRHSQRIKVATQGATSGADQRVDDKKAVDLVGLIGKNKEIVPKVVEQAPLEAVAESLGPRAAPLVWAEDDPKATTRGAAQRLSTALQSADAAEVNRVLADRSTAEIEQIRKDFEILDKTSLESKLTARLEGRDLQHAQLLLKGNDLSRRRAQSATPPC